GVLTHDREAVGMTVLDEHRSTAIEDEASRRAKRQRPLVVVLGHLLIFRVLHDLHHPEPDGEQRESESDPRLKKGQADADLATIFVKCQVTTFLPFPLGPC